MASWMRQAAGALKEYVAVRGSAVVRPSYVMGNPADTPIDLLAYLMWNILRESRTAYAGTFNRSDGSNADPGNRLESLPWEQAAASGGQSFISFGDGGGDERTSAGSGRGGGGGRTSGLSIRPRGARRCKGADPF